MTQVMRVARRGALAVSSLVLSACGAAVAPAARVPAKGELNAIVCMLYHRDNDDGDPGYQVMLTPGMRKTIEVGALRLVAGYDNGSTIDQCNCIGLDVFAGDAHLFRAAYQLSGPPPDNQFGDLGFTGLLFFSHPTAGGDYQAICKSVDSHTFPRSETREQFLARSRAEAKRKAARVAALRDPNQPLPKRVEALVTLHAGGERKFAGVDLQGSMIAGADLRECDLTGARFDGADLSAAQLYSSHLQRAVLRGAHLGHTNLFAAHLDDADLTDAKAERVNLESAELPGARLANADLTGTYASHAVLTSANLTGTRLVSADLTWANLTGAKLIGANLASANLQHAILDGVDLSGAKLDQWQLDQACGDAKTILPPGYSIRREPRAEIAGTAILPCDVDVRP